MIAILFGSTRRTGVGAALMTMTLATGELIPVGCAEAQSRLTRPPRVVTTGLPAIIAGYAREREFSGVVEVWQNDARVFGAHLGLAERAFGTPVRPKTRFQIASVSKLFVATVVLRLVDKGVLNLLDPVGRHVPGLHPTIARASLEDLLLHRSGLPRDAAFEPWEALELDAHVSRVAGQGPTEGHQGNYRYSNSGFVLLAKVVESATGQRFERVLQHEVLDVLRLHDTRFIVGDDVVERLAVGYARGKAGWRVPWRARHRGIYPPGGLYSTATDLARFVAGLRRAKVLSPEMARRLFEPKIEVEGGRQRAAYGGLVSRREDRDYLVIAGSGDGAKASLLYAAHSGVLIVILSNNGDLPINEMLRDVLLSLEGQRPPLPAPCRIRDPGRLASFVGEYEMSGSGFPPAAGRTTYPLTFSVEGTRAYLWNAAEQEVTLLCERPDGQLRAVETNDILVSLTGVGSEAVMVLTIEGTAYRSRSPRRLIDP